MPPLPTRSSAKAALPERGRSTSGLPTGTRSQLPDRFWYEPPPAALFGATGTLEAVGAPCATATFTASGVLDAVGAGAAGAEFSAVGVLAVPFNSADAEFSGVGALSAVAVPAATAAFSGAGLLAAVGAPALTAQFSGAGAMTAPAVPTATAALSGAGALTATATVFAPSSMTKDGTFTQSSTSYTKVTGWAADTTGYPGSTVSSDELVIQSSSTGITIAASVVWTGSSFTRQITMRLLQNGTVIATGSAASIPVSPGTGTATVTATNVTVTAGDVIRLEAIRDFGTGNPTATTNSASYVRATKP
ncbi:hypothetical protein [Nocardia wallacei]|uniref:hypothetical protein n=1 Tax=Nocardia wallacei TaxID=480035 RepID=UPI0024585D3B|nr:hypothetical protein [Nocardia wallacei]